MSLDTFIRNLPKTETHLHIEGALPWGLLQSLDPEKFGTIPKSWADDFKFKNFAHFETELIQYATAWYTSAERYHEAAKAIFKHHLAQNVQYVETSFASVMVEHMGIPGSEIATAIQSAAPAELEVRVFLGLPRSGNLQALQKLCDQALKWKDLDGIDLHGIETIALDDWHRQFWPRARDAGKFTKAHAGEFGGADSVVTAIEELGVHRIQHGIRAAEEEQAIHKLRSLDITLDICPISNVKLGVVESLAQHPIRRLHNAGIRCTVNTDDPIAFGNTLEKEYNALATELNFTQRELAQIARNGFEIALMDKSQKKSHLAYLDRILAKSEESKKSPWQKFLIHENLPFFYPKNYSRYIWLILNRRKKIFARP